MDTKIRRSFNNSKPIDEANLSKMDRKAKKPIMEKKRRKRINDSLNDLKNILLEIMKKDPTQTAKLEKADILEFTVQYLRSNMATATNMTAISPQFYSATGLHKNYANFSTAQTSGLWFLSGWNSCITETMSILKEFNVPANICGLIAEKLNHRFKWEQQQRFLEPAFHNHFLFNPRQPILSPIVANHLKMRQSNSMTFINIDKDIAVWRPW